MANRLYVGTRKGLITFDHGNGSERWRISRTAFPGEPVTMVLPDRHTDAVYAALRLGHFGPKLQRSHDGVTWQECAMPTFAVGKADEAAKAPTVDQIWSLETGGADQPQVLWAGTIPGGLFRSDDGGDSWRLMEGLWNRPERAEWVGGGYDDPGIHSICVDPRDSSHVTVAVSVGGVWNTFDGGEAWESCAQGMRAAYMPPERAYDPNIQDPHRVVHCPAAPDVLWAQHHNGIFRSTDGAASWQEIEGVNPSVFGFAVAVHPANPDIAWFVPAIKDEYRIPVDGRFVVTRTMDGGKTFATLTRGLPQADSYDLVYRHCLDVDTAGECLAMGSTTGNLWVSEDGGERWQCLSNHLPPIYCVRFA